MEAGKGRWKSSGLFFSDICQRCLARTGGGEIAGDVRLQFLM